MFRYPVRDGILGVTLITSFGRFVIQGGSFGGYSYNLIWTFRYPGREGISGVTLITSFGRFFIQGGRVFRGYSYNLIWTFRYPGRVFRGLLL